MNNKITFITELLNSKKIEASQKERLFMLTADELKKSTETDEKIIAEIDAIKKQLKDFEKSEVYPNAKLDSESNFIFDNVDLSAETNFDLSKLSNNQNSKIKIPVTETLLKESLFIHNPKKITDFLNNFRENTDLKWSSHIWESKEKYSSINDFIIGLNNDRKTYLFNDLFNYNLDLYNLIRYFLFDPKSKIIDEVPEYGWPNLNEVKIGWQTPNNLLIDWCKENYDEHINSLNFKFPMEFHLPKNLTPKNKINGKFITTYEDIVNLFKNEIQFRDDYLYDEIKKKVSTISDFTVELDVNLKGVQLYTYTRGFIMAVGRVFEMFKKNELFKDVRIYSEFKQDCFIIKINQIGSFPTKRIQESNLKSFIGGDLNIIIGNVFSLCDYSIISKFKDENGNEINGELVLLSENTKGNREKNKLKSLFTSPELILVEGKVDGFMHQFKFYL
jgi:hypothetical protein